MILPRKNRTDLSEVPAHVKRRLSFVPVDHMDDVLAQAFCEPPFQARPAKRAKKDKATP